MVPAASGALSLVRADSTRRVGLGGPARRRDRLAVQRQDTLTVVLYDSEVNVLHDPPFARTSGLAGVFHHRIRQDPVSDFSALTTRWPTHCGRPAWFTCCATEAGGEVQIDSVRLARVCEVVRQLLGDAIRLWRLRRTARRNVRLAARRADTAFGNAAPDGLGQWRGARLIRGEKAPSRPVYVPGSRWGPIRQQPRRARGASGGNHPQKQLRKPERSREINAVLMTVFRTLKQRGHQPMQTIVQALRGYVLTEQYTAELPQ